MTNVVLSENAKKRVLEIINSNPDKISAEKFLRLTVKGGGCSGFQYVFELDSKNSNDDVIICQVADKVIAKTDNISTQFIEGSVIDFIEELGASYFKVINPNATANCGCGASFSV